MLKGCNGCFLRRVDAAISDLEAQNVRLKTLSLCVCRRSLPRTRR